MVGWTYAGCVDSEDYKLYDVSVSVVVMEIVLVGGSVVSFIFFFQAEDGIRDLTVTGVQTCALPISTTAFTSTCRLSPDRGREKSSRLSTMRRQRCTSASTILRYSWCAWRSAGASSSLRNASASQQARIVASGLLISCITPAASCPTAASFSVSDRRCWAWRHSVMSSPMVITWEMC